jgi:pseudouridylate synthase
MPPFVALESSVFVQGLPVPFGVDTALRMEEIVRAAGAVPRTVGILQGEPVVGLSSIQIRRLAGSASALKVTLANLPVATARGADGGTTVAATLWLAHSAGIEVFATGGIGGVHRGAGSPGMGSFDVSADLDALSALPLIVVCSGPKVVLDLAATREVLETRGVTLVGYGVDEMPAFYCRNSGLPVDVRCDSPEEVVELFEARRRLRMPGAMLVTVPVPRREEIPFDELAPLIDRAVDEARDQGLRAAQVTPFLLARIRETTEGRALTANVALLEQNARIASEIAVALGYRRRCVGDEP